MRFVQVASVGTLLLGGCVSVQQQTVAPGAAPPRPIAVVPAIVRPPAVVHPPVIVHKTAASGVPIVLDSANSVDPSCHSLGVPTARVTQAPVHGSVKLLQRDIYPQFPPGNPRSSCNSTKAPGIVAQYASTAGFTGSDFTAVDVIFPDGKEAEFKFAITVK